MSSRRVQSAARLDSQSESMSVGRRGLLFNAIFSDETLLAAFERVADNGGRCGVDGVEIDDFGLRAERNLLDLQRDLRNDTYFPAPLLIVYVPKRPGSEDRRRLSIPIVRDRVAMTAAAMVLTPVLEPWFADESYAYRKGRSVSDAVSQITRLRDQGYAHVLDADISDFFGQVDHEILLRRLRRVIQERALVALIESWLRADVKDGDERRRNKRGLPQGSPVSPLLANFYLDELDSRLKDLGFKIVRYADDFLVLCRRPRRVEDARARVCEILADLRLRINEGKTCVTDFHRGFRYLGQLFVGRLVIPSSARDELEEEIEKDASSVPVQKLPLSMPDAMHPFLRTLYVKYPGTRLGKEGGRLVVNKGSQRLFEVPMNRVDNVVLLGSVGISTPAVRALLDQGASVTLLTRSGRMVGRIDRTDRMGVDMMLDQARKSADYGFRRSFAAAVVRAKISNQRTLVRRNLRRRADQGMRADLAVLQRLKKDVSPARDLDQLRGMEGKAASIYFQAFGQLLKHRLGFVGRRRRPPTDPVNAMLSFGYTLLSQNVHSIVAMNRLHPEIGFFHSSGRGHAALVSDLVEELRAPVVDGLVLRLVNNGELRHRDFYQPRDAERACIFKDEALRRFIDTFERRISAQVKHPATGWTVSHRRLIELQIRELILFIRGDRDEYRPFLIR